MKCADCEQEATRVYKAYYDKPDYNIFLCDAHSDDIQWRNAREHYAPIRISLFRSQDAGSMEEWEREWQYLQRCETGYVMVHPKAKVYRVIVEEM